MVNKKCQKIKQHEVKLEAVSVVLPEQTVNRLECLQKSQIRSIRSKNVSKTALASHFGRLNGSCVSPSPNVWPGTKVLSPFQSQPAGRDWSPGLPALRSD